MLTFEDVLEIFRDYLALDTSFELFKSRRGYVRVEFQKDSPYCIGEICNTPEELFDLLLANFKDYMEIRLTGGCRELSEQEAEMIENLRQEYLEIKSLKASAT